MSYSTSIEIDKLATIVSADHIKKEIEVPIEYLGDQDCIVCLTKGTEYFELTTTHTVATVTPVDVFLSKFIKTERSLGDTLKFVCKKCLDLINLFEQAELEYVKAKDDFEMVIQRNPLFSMPQPIRLERVKNEIPYFTQENHDSSDSENETLLRVKNKMCIKTEELDEGQIKDGIDIVEPIIEVSYPEEEKKFKEHDKNQMVDGRLWTTGTVPAYESKKDEQHDSTNKNLSSTERPICNYCHRQFMQKSNLIKHLRIHTGEVPYGCHHCQRRFTRRDNLVKHLRTHSGEKRYECDVCNKKFKEKSPLITHKRVHTGEVPYKCHICDRRFKDRSNLRTHMRMHTGEEPFQCNICHKTFKQKVHMDSHIRTHTGEKPFQCSVCSRWFKDKSILKKHFRTHTCEAPYECDICHSRFKQTTRLKMHQRLIHTTELQKPVNAQL